MCPCKDCGERYVGCHGKCQAYVEWKKAQAVIAKRRKDDNMLRIYKNSKGHLVLDENSTTEYSYLK